MNQSNSGIFGELKAAFAYIVLVAVFIWLPVVVLIAGQNPIDLFGNGRGLFAALIFVSGALLANATAVGGGLVFNPSFQLVLGISGYHSLALSILVQCAGMSSGSYGWYRKDAFRPAGSRHLLQMATVTVGATAVCTLLLLFLMKLLPVALLLVMRSAGVFVSIYVFVLVMKSIGNRESHLELAKLKAHRGDTDGLLEEIHIIEHMDEGDLGERGTARLKIDRRIFLWIVLGVMLNVSTAVGVGELVFSHLIKYYDTPPKTAIAVGTLLQAVSVITQAVFILWFLRELIVVDLVCIGLLFCVVGGRLAPLLMTRRKVEPFAKPILAYTALGMGLTTAFLLFSNFFPA